MNNYISLAEYAKLHGITAETIRQRCKRGLYNEQQARKIGRNWVIREDTPHIDHRIGSPKKYVSDEYNK